MKGLLPVVIGIVGVIIAVGYCASILAEVKTDVDESINETAYPEVQADVDSVFSKGFNAFATFGTIITLTVVGILLGVLYTWGRRG